MSVEKQKDLPKGWEVAILENCVEILDSKRKPVSAKERANREGNVPYYGATGQAGWIDDYIFNEELILIGEDGAPFFDKGKNVAYKVVGKSWVNNHAHVLKGYENILLNDYLLHYLNQVDYTGYVGGTTRLKLNQANLKILPILLPPLAEQKRIVAKLDAFMEQIAEAKKGLQSLPQLLKDFRQSVLSQAVTGKLTQEWREGKDLGEWQTEVLKNICTKIQDGAHHSPKNQSPIREKGMYPYITSKNIRNNFMDLKNVMYVDEEYHNSIYPRCTPELGDVLLTKDGANTGNVTLNEMNEPFSLLSSVALLKTKKDILLSTYLKYYIQSPQGKEKLMGQMTGTAIKRLVLKKIKDAEITLPPLEEQKEIVRRVEALFLQADAIESQYKALKEKVETLPQATLAKAFRGELVAQDSADEPASVLLAKITALRESLGGKKKK